MQANKLQHLIQQQNSDELLTNSKTHQFLLKIQEKTFLSSFSKWAEVLMKQPHSQKLNTFQALLFVQHKVVQFYGVILMKQFILFIKRTIFLTRNLTSTLGLSPLCQYSSRARQAKTFCLLLMIRACLCLLIHATQLN
jgi:hypothetical protein